VDGLRCSTHFHPNEIAWKSQFGLVKYIAVAHYLACQSIFFYIFYLIMPNEHLYAWFVVKGVMHKCVACWSAEASAEYASKDFVMGLSAMTWHAVEVSRLSSSHS
jgi:hypothetical protein